MQNTAIANFASHRFKYQSSSFSYTKENKITDKKRARNKIPCSFFVLKYIFQNYLPLTEAYREIVQDANRRQRHGGTLRKEA